MRPAALLAAAGRGERFGAGGSKALVELAGRSLLQHALRTLDASTVEAFVVAAPVGQRERFADLAAGPKLLAVVEGGPSRQASILAALEAVPEEFDAIVCQDVARPLARPQLFDRVLEALDVADGAVPVVRISETVKEVDSDPAGETAPVRATLPRDRLWLAQTPQAFRREVLLRAHLRAIEDGYEATDDAGLVERAGFKVVAVRGDPANLKVTTPLDLRLVAALLGD